MRDIADGADYLVSEGGNESARAESNPRSRAEFERSIPLLNESPKKPERFTPVLVGPFGNYLFGSRPVDLKGQ